ncbi:MAG: hypothetical protein OZSIB_2386 [Candidatus Ozemobacter sibiricus]|uniref:ATP-grasp domain-containing protein n=1 Tax=Candidatus Ozemobacter sibiricus TaxID=2268124 RepID=A0A367ZTH6_9BACT|nr:MAG: hypothetical protein OZSIB_2386 [Candidatus Ozemobacter sibiricus]
MWWAAALGDLPSEPAPAAPTMTFEDRWFGRPEGKDLPWPESWRDALLDRGILRERLAKAGLPIPRWTRARSFEEASRWAVASQRFPLAIKSAINGSEGQGVYRLEGFRELSGFFERIKAQAPTADVILEDWVAAKAVVEVTMVPGRPPLVAQKGLARSLQAGTAWRMFPISLPAREAEAIRHLQETLRLAEAGPFPLLRLTIALTGQDCFLLAISGAVNRPEYHAGWCEAVGLAPLLGPGQPSAASPPASTPRFARLQFLGRPARLPPFPPQAPATKEFEVKRYFAAGHRAMALLTGNDPTELARQAVLLARLLEESTAA